jgi:hypothetical protein
MDSILISYVLPALGIVILLFCLGSFVFPYGDRFKGKIQKVKAFGLDLEVSVITFFVIIGVIFSFTGVYIQIKNYEGQLASTKEQLDYANKKLEEKKRQNVTAYITLENVDVDSLPSSDDMACKYYFQLDDKPYSTDVNKTGSGDRYKIELKDVPPAKMIEKLEFKDRVTGRQWIKGGFYPLFPEYVLEEN